MIKTTKTVVDETDHYIYLEQLILFTSASKEQQIKRRITTYIYMYIWAGRISRDPFLYSKIRMWRLCRKEEFITIASYQQKRGILERIE